MSGNGEFVTGAELKVDGHLRLVTAPAALRHRGRLDYYHLLQEEGVPAADCLENIRVQNPSF